MMTVVHSHLGLDQIKPVHFLVQDGDSLIYTKVLNAYLFDKQWYLYFKEYNGFTMTNVQNTTLYDTLKVCFVFFGLHGRN